MAAPRNKPLTLEHEPESLFLPAPENNPLPETDYDDVTSLNKVLSELGADDSAGGFVTVFRDVMKPGGKRENEYLDRFDAGDFSLDGLKSRWGAGRYNISVYRAGGGGLAARKVITIAKEPEESGQVAPQSSGNADLASILAVMQQGFEKMFMAITATSAAPATPAPTRADMLHEMQIMREMFAPAAQAVPAQSLDAVALLKLGAEMAANGGGESNNAWVGKVIDQLAPVLLPALAGAAQASRAPAPAPMQHPQPAQLAAPAPTASPIEEENPVNIIIMQYLNMLKNAAAKNAPVEEYADSILNSIPASSAVDLENMLRPETWRSELAKHTQAVEQYPAWFSSLRDTLLMFIDEDKAVPILTGGESSGSVPAHETANSGISTENHRQTGGVE